MNGREKGRREDRGRKAQEGRREKELGRSWDDCVQCCRAWVTERSWDDRVQSCRALVTEVGITHCCPLICYMLRPNTHGSLENLYAKSGLIKIQ